VASLTVFLDANVLFPAAVGGPAFKMIWEPARRGRIRLVTSAHCRAEAMRVRSPREFLLEGP